MSILRRMAAFANGVGRRVAPPVAGMVACAILCVAAAGCDGDKAMVISNAAEFQEVVLKADRPILVDFYKAGCPACISLDATMDQLAEEYKGRAIVAKFMLVQPYFVITSPELKEKYAISSIPTAILFVNGRETWRFALAYDIEDYRKAMNEALGVPSTQKTSLDSGRSSGN